MNRRFPTFVATLVAAVAVAGGATGADLPKGAPFPAGLAALETEIVRGATPGDLVAYAFIANPMIRAERARWRSAVERYRVDTGWENPELMLEGMYMQETFGQREKPDEWTVRLTQPIPLPGKLSGAGAVAAAEARIARLRVDAAVRDVVTAIRESYQELLYLRDARRTAALNGELIDKLRKSAEGAYAANRVALFDVMKAQAQSGQLQYDAVLLEELERTEKARLNGLLSRSPEAPVGPPVDVPLRPVVFDLPEIQAFADNNFEENRIARAGVEKAQAMQTVARYETLPEFRVGASYGKEDEQRTIGLQVGVMLPVWWGRNAGRLEAAKADVETMAAMRQAQQNDTRTAVSETFFRLRNAERLVTLYRDDLLPQAERAIASADTLFRQGQGAFSDYAETQATDYGFRLSLARAKADYGKWLARLEKLAGRSLTDREGGNGPANAAGVGR